MIVQIGCREGLDGLGIGASGRSVHVLCPREIPANAKWRLPGRLAISTMKVRQSMSFSLNHISSLTTSDFPVRPLFIGFIMRQAELIEHNKLPRLRELDVEMDPPPLIQGHPRIIPMVNRAPLPPMGRPEAMEMGLPPPGPYREVCFPIPNEIDKGSFQNQYDVFGRFFGPSSVRSSGFVALLYLLI